MSNDDIDAWWLHPLDHLVDHATRGPRVTYPGQCVDGYIQWFHRISHPYLIPPVEGAPPRVPVREPVGDLVRGPESSSTGTQSVVSKFTRIYEILQGMIDRGEVKEGSPAWEGTRQALSIALSGIYMTGVTYQKKRKTRSAI